MRYFYRELKEGQPLPPWWWGYAYRVEDRNTQMWAPLPLNYVHRFRHWLRWKWNRFRSQPSWIDSRERKAEKRGLDMGFNLGYAHGRAKSRTQPFELIEAGQATVDDVLWRPGIELHPRIVANIDVWERGDGLSLHFRSAKGDLQFCNCSPTEIFYRLGNAKHYPYRLLGKGN